jgi:alkyl hydroperoxide reductase subunit F
MYDLAIIGGGPAGVAAGVYASRKQLKTVFIAESFGGQSIVSDGIENWIGDIKISGVDLAKKLENHLTEYAGEFVDIKKGERVAEITGDKESGFTIKTNKDSEFKAKSVLVATGSSRRRLPIPGADELEHKGLTYCATCDGPLFSGKDVVVIGGGNSALESAVQLSAYAKSVTLMHRRDEFRGDPVTIQSLEKDPKVNFLLNAEPTEILGDKFVSGIKYREKETGEEKELKVEGIFVEIGAVPASSFVEGLVDMTESKTIIIDPWTQRTSVEGVWAAGDITNGKYHQNNIAAGDAVKALEDIYVWVKQR